jgi:hypothetical protein
MKTRKIQLAASVGFALALIASSASAVAYNVDWMQLTPTPFGSAPPFSGTYNLPGIGAVQMTYTANPDFTEARFQNPALAAGTLTYAGDTYSWTNNEVLGRTNWAYSGVLNSPWQVTYTFPGTVSAGQIVVGTIGLGRRNPNTNESPIDVITRATVNQNGTYFGDWTGALNVGPAAFSSGPGTFSLINSLSGPGGVDPWWNTGLSLVRVNDAVSSLTVYFNHTSGDGAGVNIGVITPEPATLGMLALGGLAMLRQRHRTRVA